MAIATQWLCLCWLSPCELPRKKKASFLQAPGLGQLIPSIRDLCAGLRAVYCMVGLVLPIKSMRNKKIYSFRLQQSCS